MKKKKKKKKTEKLGHPGPRYPYLYDEKKGQLQFSPAEIHWLLIDHCYGGEVDEDNSAAQAMFCPYYVNLEGDLGSDWGVIINPASHNFGRVVFEHHSCGCPQDYEGTPLHGMGQQGVDEWVRR